MGLNKLKFLENWKERGVPDVEVTRVKNRFEAVDADGVDGWKKMENNPNIDDLWADTRLCDIGVDGMQSMLDANFRIEVPDSVARNRPRVGAGSIEDFGKQQNLVDLASTQPTTAKGIETKSNLLNSTDSSPQGKINDDAVISKVDGKKKQANEGLLKHAELAAKFSPLALALYLVISGATGLDPVGDLANEAAEAVAEVAKLRVTRPARSLTP